MAGRDKYGVALPLLLSTVTSSFAVLVIWGLSRHYWSVTLVAILFGGFSGGFVVLRNRFATAVVGDSDHPNQELIVSGVLMLLRGIATLGSGFLGAKLVQETETMALSSNYGGGRWKPLLLTDGILMGAASLGALGFLGKRRLKGVNRPAP